MTERTQILQAGDADWDWWCNRAAHDFYHTERYHAFSQSQGEGTAHLVVHGSADRFLAWPYLRRDITAEDAIGLSDAGSVYGYSGPIGRGLDDPAFRQQAWRACCEVWSEQRVVSLFTRFHPVLDNVLSCTDFHGEAEPPGGEHFLLGRTVSIDLRPARDARRASYQKILRQEIRSAERKGLTVEHDTHWHCYPRFAELYRATMQDNAAADRYLFSDAYFAELRDALGPLGHLAVARVDGEPAAILLFTVCGDIAQAHLTGVDTRFRRLSPLKGLIDGVADIAGDHGAHWLHLGAGRGGFEDSLFDFKSRFSSIRHRFMLGRYILDADAYARLSAARADRGGEDRVSFFPAYRA